MEIAWFFLWDSRPTVFHTSHKNMDRHCNQLCRGDCRGEQCSPEISRKRTHGRTMFAPTVEVSGVMRGNHRETMNLKKSNQKGKCLCS